MRTISGTNRILRYALLSPAVVILFLTTTVPILYMIATSFYRLDPIVFNRDWPFVGAANYIAVLTKDPMF